MPAGQMSPCKVGGLRAVRECPADPARRATILLAYDDPGIREMISLLLQRAGFVVIGVKTGEEAVRTFDYRGGEVDLLLFDLCLTKMSGWTAYCEIARCRADIPHLFLGSMKVKAVAAEAGLQDQERFMIRKPFKPEWLLTRIDETLR